MKLKIFILRRKNIFIYAGIMNREETKGRPGGKISMHRKKGFVCWLTGNGINTDELSGSAGQLIFYVI